MLKKYIAITLLSIFTFALLQSCGNHCDCPNFKAKKHNYKKR